MGSIFGGVVIGGVLVFVAWKAVRGVVGMQRLMREILFEPSKYDEEASDLFAQQQRRKALELRAERMRKEGSTTEEKS